MYTNTNHIDNSYRSGNGNPTVEFVYVNIILYISNMKKGLNLQRDIQVKMMNKLIPTFTIDHCWWYNGGQIFVTCKVKVKRVRKYSYDIPSWCMGSIYELDIVVSDIVYTSSDGGKRTPKSFISDNKVTYNRGLRLSIPQKATKYINMIDSNHYSITISKIQYNL